MEPNFEIKYLELNWYDKNTLTKVTESISNLPVEYDHQRNVFHAETTIYPRVSGVYKGQLAVRFLDENQKQPYFELSNGGKVSLSKIVNPETGTVWWLAKEKWDKKSNQWLGVAPNIVGKIQLKLQDKTCVISINGADFDLEQLEQYLQAFKNDLWELILDEGSVVSYEIEKSEGVGISEETIECVAKLVSNAEKVLTTPKVELREVQTLKPRKAVKPVNRTFMELASRSNHRFLTSRATEPSYNVAENRYIFFAVKRCYKILQRLVIRAADRARRYGTKAEKLQIQHDNLVNRVTVDRNMVVQDLQKIRERTKLEYWQQRLEKKLGNCDLVLYPESCDSQLLIKLENPLKEQDGYFVQTWNGREWEKHPNGFNILSLRHKYSALFKILEPGMCLNMDCNFTCRDNGRSVIYHIDRLNSIQLLDFTALKKARETFEKEKEIGRNLAESNWVKELSKGELEEQRKEKAALANRITFYKKNYSAASFVHEKLEPKLSKIGKIIKEFENLNINPSAFFPNSMVFVQNSHYQGVHNNYKKLLDVTDLTDDKLLMNLEEIDEIGLINMPLLYERWTLIQIIYVLREVFRFIPQDGWKYRLIEALKTNHSGISLSLDNEDSKRFIKLWYEKKLPNNKVPDFIIDLTWYAENDINNQYPQFKRFVLDAKFYDKETFSREGGMMSKVNELADKKEYSENGLNPVFLIHPCRNIVENQTTSQGWGKYSFLGELNIDNSEGFFPHEKGAIFLNPLDRVLYSDELQRLLGMFLQYKLESCDTSEIDNDKTLAVPICIRCGSTNILKLAKTSGYYDKNRVWVNRTPRSVWMQCKECEQIQIYNHCGSRDDNSTRIIKNGLYWSYHSARALEPFNMKCPSCGEWGAW